MQEGNLMKLLSLIQTLWNTCLGFCLGKSYVEKKRFKQQVKQLQQWQRNRYKSSTDVSNALKKGKFIIILALVTTLGGCSTTTAFCPPLVAYTQEEQLELNQKLEQYQDEVLDRYILDYGNLREKIRYCQ